MRIDRCAFYGKGIWAVVSAVSMAEVNPEIEPRSYLLRSLGTQESVATPIHPIEVFDGEVVSCSDLLQILNQVDGVVQTEIEQLFRTGVLSHSRPSRTRASVDARGHCLITGESLKALIDVTDDLDTVGDEDVSGHGALSIQMKCKVGEHAEFPFTMAFENRYPVVSTASDWYLDFRNQACFDWNKELPLDEFCNSALETDLMAQSLNHQGGLIQPGQPIQYCLVEKMLQIDPATFSSVTALFSFAGSKVDNILITCKTGDDRRLERSTGTHPWLDLLKERINMIQDDLPITSCAGVLPDMISGLSLSTACNPLFKYMTSQNMPAELSDQMQEWLIGELTQLSHLEEEDEDDGYGSEPEMMGGQLTLPTIYELDETQESDPVVSATTNLMTEGLTIPPHESVASQDRKRSRQESSEEERNVRSSNHYQQPDYDFDFADFDLSE